LEAYTNNHAEELQRAVFINATHDATDLLNAMPMLSAVNIRKVFKNFGTWLYSLLLGPCVLNSKVMQMARCSLGSWYC
jgi:hypothetical protein